MSDKSKIEWTDATWNPIRGCSRVSEGCRHCYAESVAGRFSGPGLAYEGLAEFKIIGEGTAQERREAHWTGKVKLVEEHLEDPLRWRRPRKIFVNSMSDLFHESVPDSWIARIYGIMAMAHRHTFQILTKRPERQRDFLTMLAKAKDPSELLLELTIDADGDPYFSDESDAWISNAIHGVLGKRGDEDWNVGWPMRHVQQGVSIEDDNTVKKRVQFLSETPAAVRFVSAEPLLGPVDLSPYLHEEFTGDLLNGPCQRWPRLDWVIAGGESGPGARPMHPNWARQLRDQCVAAGVPFFFKQWGEWVPDELGDCNHPSSDGAEGPAAKLGRDVAIWKCGICNRLHAEEPVPFDFERVGKHEAGAMLDGKEWKQFPSVQTIANPPAAARKALRAGLNGGLKPTSSTEKQNQRQ